MEKWEITIPSYVRVSSAFTWAALVIIHGHQSNKAFYFHPLAKLHDLCLGVGARRHFDSVGVGMHLVVCCRDEVRGKRARYLYLLPRKRQLAKDATGPP